MINELLSYCEKVIHKKKFLGQNKDNVCTERNGMNMKHIKIYAGIFVLALVVTVAANILAPEETIAQTERSASDVQLLARAVNGEARGEPYEGQVAVGAVVLNRVDHPSFPNSISGVIYQQDAFTCLYDGQFNEPVAESAYRAAQDALNGWDPSYGAIYYFNPVTATSAWIWSRPLIVTIGRHRFCA